MKKTLLVSMLLFMGLMASAQTLPKNAEGNIEYTEVVEVSGQTAAQLFENAKAWAAANGLKKKEEDAADHKIVYTGTIHVNYPSVKKGGFDDGTVTYQVAIFCKDGRYKYRVYGFTHTADHADAGKLESYKPKCGNSYMLQASWLKIKRDTAEATDKIIKAMKDRMRGLTGSGLDDKNDNW